MSHTPIVCKEDSLLTVYIDRSQSSARVFYTYDGGEDQPTVFQTADMPMDDQRAAAMVNDWIDCQA